jgi:aconitate hydratase 2/2-methylisocitrate dehydratase
MQPGITLRDLVQAIPYVAIQQGLVSAKKGGKSNVFSGRIVEIEGLSHLECEQAFELTAATAERSAAACTVKLDQQSVIRYVKSNVTLLKWLISKGYGDADTLKKRITQMEEWLLDPVLLEADPHAEYAAVLDIDMNEIKEPVLALPNDPDACAYLSQVAGTPVDEVFIGSCMSNIGQFRSVAAILGQTGEAVPTRLFLCPPTKMDKVRLREEGHYSTFCTAGARTELPGCSLCMGNQFRVATGSTVVSTSTRNFPNRMGKDANVYLASAELAAVTSILGRLPTVEEYMVYMKKIKENETEIYQYLQFDQMQEFVNNAAESRKY